jgi:hypothetical protein
VDDAESSLPPDDPAPAREAGGPPARPAGGDPARAAGGPPARAAGGPPARECRFSSHSANPDCKALVAAVAVRQFGRIRYDQLRSIVGKATITKWRKAGYLHPVLPRVYAVGHPGRTIESDLSEALLYSGPGAALSHGTAIWWLGLLKYPPADGIHVSTPRSVRSLDGLVIHGRRQLERQTHNGLPTTTPSQALLDLAATNPELLRLALANADYHGVLDTDAIGVLIAPGTKGSKALRKALQIHLPQLTFTRSDGEYVLLVICQSRNWPLPLVNVYVNGHLVDNLWQEQKLIVEIDGYDGHRTRAQLERDHQRDLELRAAGYIVLRYTLRQLKHSPDAVAAELARYLVAV